MPAGGVGADPVGRAARSTTWTVIDEWVDEWSRGPLPKARSFRGTIGSNPSRRYGSASSRALGGR
jgi:polyhydroxyalkanoate synthase